ncbi:MAG: lycopene beta-cyclase CrtY [Pseudomonadota bacterium]
MDASKPNRVDVAIVGGGLSGALIAYRLHQRRPDLSLAILERDGKIGGEHTWSFHTPDVSADALAWLQPFIVHRWDAQSVVFPSYGRRFTTGYCSITSDRLATVIETKLGSMIRTHADVADVQADHVMFENGDQLSAGAVIDCRGDQRSEHVTLGFQKFVGQEIRFKEPHGVEAPIIMDASVSQKDGYRFVYVLPFDERTALVEDTRYADGAHLDAEEIKNDIADYVTDHGWAVEEILREEDGVLPIALSGDINAYWNDGRAGVARAGMRGVLFHPLTGYSLPHAVALADLIAGQDDFSSEAIYGLTRRYSTEQWEAGSFYRLLCRMLFRAAEPSQRYKVLERFYKLPQPLIERFYAGVTPVRDKARILVGKPPVPISRAISVLASSEK